MLFRMTAALALALTLPAAALASDVNTWSGNANNNIAAPPHGFPSNISPSQVHPTVREIMAAVRRWQQRMTATVTSGGSGNAQTLTYTEPPTECLRGDTYMFIAGASNTGAMTLNNGACTAPVKLGADNLTGGEVVSGRAVMVTYDGANWQLLSGASGGGGESYIALHGGGCISLHGGGCITLHGP